MHPTNRGPPCSTFPIQLSVSALLSLQNEHQRSSSSSLWPNSQPELPSEESVVVIEKPRNPSCRQQFSINQMEVVPSNQGGHHRPRIKLKRFLSLDPAVNKLLTPNLNSLLLRPLTPDLIIILSLVTLWVTLFIITTTASTVLPGACASSINPSSNFSEQQSSLIDTDEFIPNENNVLNQLEIALNEQRLELENHEKDLRAEESLAQERSIALHSHSFNSILQPTSSKNYDVHSRDKHKDGHKKDADQTHLIGISNRNKRLGENEARGSGYSGNPNDLNRLSDLGYENSDKSQDFNNIIAPEEVVKVSFTLPTVANPASAPTATSDDKSDADENDSFIKNLRPLPHFSNKLSQSSTTNTRGEDSNDKVVLGASRDGNGLQKAGVTEEPTTIDDMQADEPLTHLDNKAETDSTIRSKISKSSKSKSQSSLLQINHNQVVGEAFPDNLKASDTTQLPRNQSKLSISSSPAASPTSTGIYVGNNNNRIVSLAKGPSSKPRRLESLSYGVKNLIPNSIHFEDYEYEGGASSFSKVSTADGPTIQGDLSHHKEDVGWQNSSGYGKDASSPSYGFRRSPLQIRRDLSRLVAGAGSGNGIDDELGGLSKCDRLFISSPNGLKNGTFESPSLALEDGHLYQCIFMFVARPNERVEIIFHDFKVRGTPPECVHEWVDIWTEVEGTDPTDLITTPFSGRYCGKIPPRRRISLYGGIAVGFYSDRNVTDESVFRGQYTFINESRYIVGTPVPRTLCSYTILGATNKGMGELLSPTYPGVYPKNLSCSYKFIGTAGQRIRIEFRDFDIFYGGAHCPFDDVKIYDGADPTSPLIGTYCGQQRNLVVYSSENTMLVTFTTLDRNTDSQNRGFNAVYEFSNSFVKLDFIEKNMGDHIRGTECDQRILSKSQSTGIVYSPNYPYPYVLKIVCRYFIYGLQDPQNLERIRLAFEVFDVPSKTNSGEDTDDPNQSDAKRCGDGFLKVYLKGQEVIQAYDKADFEFCGKELPHAVVSDGPRLVLVFSSGETQGSGIKANYTFETEYRVPGTARPDGTCHFTYYSAGRVKGEFNSPRFPSNYPSGTNCTYLFHLEQPDQQVRIIFENFKLKADKFNYTDRGAYGNFCDEDWVEIWNVMSNQEDRLVGRYCGTTAPGPIESREKAEALKVILHTDEEGVYSGFKARYVFFKAKTVFGDCGQNVTQANSGELTSPKWPGKYDGPSKGDGSSTCNWYLTVRPGSRVMLHFQQFSIEGEPAGRGCPAAAVRIWEDLDAVPVELCGETLSPENTQFVSTRNTMRITFITADKAVGAPGFRAIWTEVQDGGSGAQCHPTYFRCSTSQFCIPKDLHCDGTQNCGIGSIMEQDSSDESDWGKGGIDIDGVNLVFIVGVAIAVSLFLIIILCAWGQRRKRHRRRRHQLRRPPIHVCDNAGARFAAMDSV